MNTENRLISTKEDGPMEDALCVFRVRNIFVLGYLKGAKVIRYGIKNSMQRETMITDWDSFQYVLNEEGNMMFVKSEPEFEFEVELELLKKRVGVDADFYRETQELAEAGFTEWAENAWK